MFLIYLCIFFYYAINASCSLKMTENGTAAAKNGSAQTCCRNFPDLVPGQNTAKPVHFFAAEPQFLLKSNGKTVIM